MWSMASVSRSSWRDLPPLVAPEVRPHPGPQVGGLAHVEHPPAQAPEEVDARARGAAGGELELAHLGVGPDGGQLEEVVEAEDADGAGPLEQGVEQVGGGQGVGHGPVAGLVGQAHAVGEGGQPAVGHLVAHQAAGQGAGVDPPVAEPGVALGRPGRPGGS